MPEPKPSSRHEYELRINRAMDYIREHLAEPLALDVIAQAACFSTFHFHRIFGAVTGETVHDFVWRLRAETAVNRLYHEPLRPVIEIALECGFSSASNFAKALKKQFGLSATEIRKICKKNSKPGARIRKPGAAGAKNSVYAHYSKGWKHSPGCKLSPVEIIQFPATRIAYVRVLKGYEKIEIFKAGVKLYAWAKPRGVYETGARLLGISLDNPGVTPWERCRFDLALTIPADFKVTGNINTTEIPGRPCARYRFEGTADQFENAFHYFYLEWLPGSGYQPDDFPPFQFFVKDPKQKPWKKFVTDIHIMLKSL